jgi:hypothetical protein
MVTMPLVCLGLHTLLLIVSFDTTNEPFTNDGLLIRPGLHKFLLVMFLQQKPLANDRSLLAEQLSYGPISKDVWTKLSVLPTSGLQTYLEQNEGPGLQHLALKTHDIISTLREMRARSQCGGFEFMPRPSDKYYKQLPEKVVSSSRVFQGEYCHAWWCVSCSLSGFRSCLVEVCWELDILGSIRQVSLSVRFLQRVSKDVLLLTVCEKGTDKDTRDSLRADGCVRVCMQGVNTTYPTLMLL